MRVSSSLLAFAAIAIAAPQDMAPQSSSTDNQVDDLLAAYSSASAQLAPAVAAPVGKVEETKPIDTATIASAAAAQATSGSNVSRRSGCQPEPASPYTYKTSPDSAADFAHDTTYSNAANSAMTPSGYSLVPGYKNLNASAQAPVYQGVSSSLSSYDPSVCSKQCSSINGCTSFVIYFERDPTVDANEASCLDPPSLTRVKCAFYGIPLTASQATNDGQYRGNFHVVIAGANAYTNQPPTPAGYKQVDALGDRAIISPPADGTYLSVQTFPNSPYSPCLCSAACDRTTQYWTQRGQPARACRFFDAYVLYKNEAGPIFTCAYYNRTYDASFATNRGQSNAQGDRFTIHFSNTYAVS